MGAGRKREEKCGERRFCGEKRGVRAGDVRLRGSSAEPPVCPPVADEGAAPVAILRPPESDTMQVRPVVRSRSARDG